MQEAHAVQPEVAAHLTLEFQVHQWDETVFYPRNCYMTSIGKRRFYFTFYKQRILSVITYAFYVYNEVRFVLPPEGILGKRKMTGESSYSTSGADICGRMREKKKNFSLLLFLILTQLSRNCSATSPSSPVR